MTPTQSTWKVYLGAREWSKHTYPRDPTDEHRLLGRAKQGMQYGALAINSEGQYVLINGDYVTNIDDHIIDLAVEHAQVARYTTERPSAANEPKGRAFIRRKVERPASM